MNIAMFTNTYLPHVGGVARSVSSYANTYRKLGHNCLVFAPEFDGEQGEEEGVVRLPAITNFNNSGFSVRLPSPGIISDSLEDFGPDIIHSHHPFLVGDTALRAAYSENVPLVFTHHTLYEQYTNYLPFHGDFTQRAAAKLATAYANACDLVFAPSESLAKLITQRGVTTKVAVQPTGIDVDFFAGGDGQRFRRAYEIKPESFVVGHVGRLAEEKNLGYLVEGVMAFLRSHPNSVFVAVGGGKEAESIREKFVEARLEKQLVMTGSLQGSKLSDAYAAFDIFGFASKSETQGLVLVEAMASGTPVVALDGPGVRDVVTDGVNGRLLPARAAPERFAEALTALREDKDQCQEFKDEARKTAALFAQSRLAAQAIEHYAEAIKLVGEVEEEREGLLDFDYLLSFVEAEFEILKVRTSAAVAASGLMDDSKVVELE